MWFIILISHVVVCLTVTLLSFFWNYYFSQAIKRANNRRRQSIDDIRTDLSNLGLRETFRKILCDLFHLQERDHCPSTPKDVLNESLVNKSYDELTNAILNEVIDKYKSKDQTPISSRCPSSMDTLDTIDLPDTPPDPLRSQSRDGDVDDDVDVTETRKKRYRKIGTLDESESSSEMYEDRVEPWEDNWLFLKKRTKSSIMSTPVSMLVPSPNTHCRALIGDQEAEDTSDLSEPNSEAEDVVGGDITSILVHAKTVIGGKNHFVNEIVETSGRGNYDIEIRNEIIVEERGAFDENGEKEACKTVGVAEREKIDPPINSQTLNLTEDIIQDMTDDDTNEHEAFKVKPEPMAIRNKIKKWDSFLELTSKRAGGKEMEDLEKDRKWLPEVFGRMNGSDESIALTEATNLAVNDYTESDESYQQNDAEYTEYATIGHKRFRNSKLSKPTSKHNNYDSGIDDGDTLIKGSIAEREHRKWTRPVEMPNNPYSPENIQKRLNRSHVSGEIKRGNVDERLQERSDGNDVNILQSAVEIKVPFDAFDSCEKRNRKSTPTITDYGHNDDDNTTLLDSLAPKDASDGSGPTLQTSPDTQTVTETEQPPDSETSDFHPLPSQETLLTTSMDSISTETTSSTNSIDLHKVYNLNSGEVAYEVCSSPCPATIRDEIIKLSKSAEGRYSMRNGSLSDRSRSYESGLNDINSLNGSVNGLNGSESVETLVPEQEPVPSNVKEKVKLFLKTANASDLGPTHSITARSFNRRTNSSACELYQKGLKRHSAVMAVRKKGLTLQELGAVPVNVKERLDYFEKLCRG